MNGDDLIERILREGERRADEVEVFYARGGLSVATEIKKGILGNAEESEAWNVAVRTVKDGRIGFSATSDPPDRWKECLDAALASGRLATPPQQWGRVPETGRSRGHPPLPRPTGISSSRWRMRREWSANSSPVPRSTRWRSSAGGADLARSYLAVANSSGVFYGMDRTVAAVSLETIREQSTGYEFDAPPRSSPISMPVRSANRLLRLPPAPSGGRDIKTGRYDVVLSPPVAAASLLGQVLLPALSGRNVKAGRSFLADKVGEQVFDERLSVYDDPFAPPGLGSTAFDAEGVPTRRLVFVEQGGCCGGLPTISRPVTVTARGGARGGAPSVSGAKAPGSACTTSSSTARR